MRRCCKSLLQQARQQQQQQRCKCTMAAHVPQLEQVLKVMLSALCYLISTLNIGQSCQTVFFRANLVDTTKYISEKQWPQSGSLLLQCDIWIPGAQNSPEGPGVVRVNEFTLAYLQFPGSLIRNLAEHSRFCLDGSQMETHFWSGAKLSASCMICSVNDGRLLGWSSPPGLSVEQTLCPKE